jgi:hypothetical protein
VAAFFTSRYSTRTPVASLAVNCFINRGIKKSLANRSAVNGGNTSGLS